MIRELEEKMWRAAQSRDRAAFLELVEGLHHERSGGGVQVSRGFVGQDDGRVIDEGACDGNPLHLTAREL